VNRLRCLVAAVSLSAPLLAGCLVRPIAVEAPPPAYRSVHFVGRVPAPSAWRFVGRVEGVAPPVDFVAAAHDARVDIKSKAAHLGATVVKIDRVRLPPEHPAAARPSVLLTGRAYRPATSDERALPSRRAARLTAARRARMLRRLQKDA
jgi:hypothetical protein